MAVLYLLISARFVEVIAPMLLWRRNFRETDPRDPSELSLRGEVMIVLTRSVNRVSVQLDDGHVHVWLARLGQNDARVREYSFLLSDEEYCRARCFRDYRSQRRFIVSRGLLRELLASYTGIDPAVIRFRYEAGGKPMLDGEVRCPALNFNLAHSHDLIVFAFSRGRKLGIDVEYVNPSIDIDLIAKDVMSAPERAIFFALPPIQRPPAFFTWWTRKESYVKATGEGLTLPLDRFDILPVSEGRGSIVRADGNVLDGRWSMRDLFLTSDYACALTVEGDERQPVCYSINERDVERPVVVQRLCHSNCSAILSCRC